MNPFLYQKVFTAAIAMLAIVMEASRITSPDNSFLQNGSRHFYHQCHYLGHHVVHLLAKKTLTVFVPIYYCAHAPERLYRSLYA